jgi:hypothetical protein
MRGGRAVALTEAALDSLDRGLLAIALASPRAFARRRGRLALMVVHRDLGHDRLPHGFVPLDDLRVVALSYNLAVDRRGGAQWRAPLAVYRPRVDLPGTGHAAFECAVVYDAAARGKGHGPVNQIDPRRNPGLARAAVLLHQAVADARPDDPDEGPVLPRLYWAYRPDRPPGFEPGYAPAGWAAAEVKVGLFRAWPAELLVREPRLVHATYTVGGDPEPLAGGDVQAAEGALGRDGVRDRWLRRGADSIPLAWPPAVIYAATDGLLGRTIRNPAFDTLRRAGLIPAGRAHRDWSDSVARAIGAGLAKAGHGDDRHPAAAFRSAVEAYASSSPAAEAGLLAEVRAGCEALGVPVPDDEEGAVQFLAGLVMAPWATVAMPDAAAVRVIRLQGPPDSAAPRLEAGSMTLELGDLGPHAGPYRPAPTGMHPTDARRGRGVGPRSAG